MQTKASLKRFKTKIKIEASSGFNSYPLDSDASGGSAVTQPSNSWRQNLF